MNRPNLEALPIDGQISPELVDGGHDKLTAIPFDDQVKGEVEAILTDLIDDGC